MPLRIGHSRRRSPASPVTGAWLKARARTALPAFGLRSFLNMLFTVISDLDCLFHKTRVSRLYLHARSSALMSSLSAGYALIPS